MNHLLHKCLQINSTRHSLKRLRTVAEMLKHSLKPVTERNEKSRRSSDSCSLVFQFEGVSLKCSLKSSLSRRYTIEQFFSLNDTSHREVLSNYTGPSSANIFPYKYCSKTCWTLAEFNLAYPDGMIADMGGKRLKQLGLFYIHAKVLWNSISMAEISIAEPVMSIDDKILCFFKTTDGSISKAYISEQANILIHKLKAMSKGELDGFTVYKNERDSTDEQCSLIIEFPLITGACGERFLKKLIEFDQTVIDKSFSFGIFQYHGAFALI